MIKEAFDRIFKEYPKARTQRFINHPLANFIRTEVPRLFAEALPGDSDLKWEASPGKGNWADAPWIAAFDPLITESAQRGFYPVYLFSRSMNSVFLSFNQGVTDLKAEFGNPQAKEILRHRATILRTRLSPDYRDKFTSKPIELKGRGSSSLLTMYEPGHTFGLKYRKGQVPATDQILEDLTSMLSLYRRALALGGTTELDVGQQGGQEQPQTQDEIRRYRLHRSIDRNARLAKAAKQLHGFVCKACGFDFERAYGELGRGYIEAHHLTPLSALPLNTPIALSPRDDFTVVCGNCHRMLHRGNAPETFGDFVKLVLKEKGQSPNLFD